MRLQESQRKGKEGRRSPSSGLQAFEPQAGSSLSVQNFLFCNCASFLTLRPSPSGWRGKIQNFFQESCRSSEVLMQCPRVGGWQLDLQETSPSHCPGCPCPACRAPQVRCFPVCSSKSQSGLDTSPNHRPWAPTASLRAALGTLCHSSSGMDPPGSGSLPTASGVP